MNKAIIVTAALLVASPAFAAGTKSQGATKYAPGQQMQKDTTKQSTAPGASEYAPGQKMQTTGSNTGKKKKKMQTTGSNTGKKKY